MTIPAQGDVMTLMATENNADQPGPEITTEFGIPLEKLDSGAYLSESGRYEIRPHGTRWKVWDHIGQYLPAEENGPPQVFRTVTAAAEAIAQQEAEI